MIELQTKRAEGNHGADWGWWLIHGNKGLGFRVQAKRLFPDGRYKSLLTKKHGADPYQQLDKLVSASFSAGVEPLYCFFNFPHPQAQFNGPNLCKHTYRAPSFWGCSLAFPDQVKKAQSTQITNLKPITHPWHMLVCESAKNDLLGAAIQFLRERGRGDHLTGPRDLPNQVRRLIELSDKRREADYRGDLDDADWHGEGDTPDGLIVVRDLRD